MNKTIKKVVILGGGTAGWISASILKKVLGSAIEIELVESKDIGTIGVGEATIPAIKLLNNMLELNEADFMQKTQATIKLAIKFENWTKENHSYYHTFGSSGKGMAFCQFHHLLKRANKLNDDSHIWQYDLNYLCAEAGKFAHINANEPLLELPYAYHFDASLYAKYLRNYSENIGVKRTEGTVNKVFQCPDSGYIEALKLADDTVINGDLFIDCSGFRAVLIQQTLKAGYEDWSHWLQCDRAVAIPSERLENTLPYTRSIAHSAGWQWRIPLQHRNGNGMVYSSQYYSDQQACDMLLNKLDSKPLADPNFLRFQTGRRYKQWHKNVVAVGLSSGFLEPLESTSIHLIQSAVVRLLTLFPNQGISQTLIDEYNKQSQLEFEQIRDFLMLHYQMNNRKDRFWQDLSNMEMPDSLAHKIELFKQTGYLFRQQNDLFNEWSWLQVLMGQGVIPQDHSPIANKVTEQQLQSTLAQLAKIKQQPISQLPDHDTFLQHFCGVERAKVK